MARPGETPRHDERGRILICDDSASIRMMIRLLLEPMHTCQLVSSGEEALAAVATFRPDLIISDLVMGGMDGFELCSRLREDPATAGVPIILLTGQTGQEERAKGLELGADDYLFKPIRERELRARVSSLLRLRRATAALQARTQELERACSDLKQVQAALIQSEKLATVGTLAAGLAHEINNPLAFMTAGVAAMLEGIRDLELKSSQESTRAVLTEMREIGGEVNDGFRRIARIVRDLKEFSSGQALAEEEIDLQEEVQRAWKMASMHSVTKPELDIHFSSPHRFATVRHHLGQVLLNVFLNAVQALEGTQGKVIVTAQLHPTEVVIGIGDNGPGIPPDLRQRVFDPFFTTKAPGKGTGLGLSVTYGIMRSLGGSIEVAPTEGPGATFNLRLPMAARPSSRPN